MKILAVIPARYDSRRFPGKPLLMLGGKSMLQRVYEQVKKSNINDVIVATDDERIFHAVISFGGEVVMTSSKHANGTSRCLETLQKTEGKFDGVINIQGDIPFIHPEQIQEVASCLQKKNTQIATLAKVISRKEDVADLNAPKVFFNDQMIATAFERQVNFNSSTQYYHHIGIYGYTSRALSEITNLQPTENEINKRLEQIRWLDNGYKIRVELTEHESVSIDTPADVKKIARLL